MNNIVHIIIGDGNTGKTTTAWLVYFLLKKIGRVDYFHLYRDGKYVIYPETETPLDEIEYYSWKDGTKVPYDFCAIIVVADIRIFIFSAGDNYQSIHCAFEWIAGEKPDFFIGCCHKHGSHAARKELKEYEGLYTMKFYPVIYDYKEMNTESAIESRTFLAEEVVSNLFPNSKLNGIEWSLNQLLNQLKAIKQEDAPYEFSPTNEAELKLVDMQEERVFDKLEQINDLMKELRPRLRKNVV